MPPHQVTEHFFNFGLIKMQDKYTLSIVRHLQCLDPFICLQQLGFKQPSKSAEPILKIKRVIEKALQKYRLKKIT